MESLTNDSLGQFRRSLQQMGVSEHTCKAYVSDLNQFLDWKEATTTRTINAEDYLNDARSWLNEANTAGKSSATLNRRRASINKFAKWAKTQPVTAEDWRCPPTDPPKPHPLPGGMSDVETMLNFCRTEDEEFLVTLCGFMGLRVAEALAVTPQDYDLTTGLLTVRGKGKRQRTLPVVSKWIKGALVWAQGSYTPQNLPIVKLGYSTARRKITEVGQEAGLSVSSHDLRATFATDVYARTKDIRTVQLLLGHQSVVTTQRYVGVDADTLRSAMPGA